MELVTGIVVYGVLWWLVFLIAMAVQRANDQVNHSLLKRLAITTAASGALWCVIAVSLFFDLIGLKQGGV